MPELLKVHKDRKADETSGKLQILLTMGFEDSQARDALAHTSSLEAAIEHLSWQGTLTARFLQGFHATVVEPAAKYIVGDSQLVSTLLELGFERAEAKAAAERCSSVEAAVQWLQGCQSSSKDTEINKHKHKGDAA